MQAAEGPMMPIMMNTDRLRQADYGSPVPHALLALPMKAARLRMSGNNIGAQEFAASNRVAAALRRVVRTEGFSVRCGDLSEPLNPIVTLERAS